MPKKIFLHICFKTTFCDIYVTAFQITGSEIVWYAQASRPCCVEWKLSCIIISFSCGHKMEVYGWI